MLISLSGFPGYGKTTQCRLLSQYYKERLAVLSVPAIFRLDSEIITYLDKEDVDCVKRNLPMAKKNVKTGILIDNYADELLYKAAEKALNMEKMVVLDGSPRAGDSLELFDCLWRTHPNDVSMIIQLVSSIHSDVEKSVSRQKYREIHIGKSVNEEQLLTKSRVYYEYVNKYLKQYLACNMDARLLYHEVDCDRGMTDIHDEIVAYIQRNNLNVLK